MSDLKPRVVLDFVERGMAWMPFFAGVARTWQALTIGEQILLLCPEGELTAGVLLRGLHSQVYPMPSADPALHTICYPD